jgi:hypothetical protein
MVSRLASALLMGSVALALPFSEVFEEIYARQNTSDCVIKDSYPAVSISELPDPFTFSDGRKVETKADFTCRQAEISKILQQYELGTYPGPPDGLQASMSGNTLSVRITVGSNTATISATISKPAQQPGAAIIGVGGSSIPIPSGIGSINFNNNAFAAQDNTGSRGQGAFYTLHGRSHSAGALTAWAWGVDRIIDGLEQVGPAASGIDTKRLGVTGCSRNGKGAFVVGALVNRIALTLPQESGSGGSACWRISDSEKSAGKNIQTASQIVTENVWFSPNFNQHTSKTNTIPADHHLLAALVAPRGLMAFENNIDWLGPVSTTGCMRAARKIYAALGVPTNMGFSMKGGNNHCSFNSGHNQYLTAYISYFLQGGTTAPPAVEEGSTVDMGKWAPWTLKTLT